MIEVFKPVPNYPDYEVSNFGDVKSLKYGKERILKPAPNSNGYLQVDLRKKGERKIRKVHKLVAEAFLDHKPNGHILVINHINLNKLDNRLENLEIVTTRENTNRKHLKSTSKFTGVSWNTCKKKWLAQIYLNRNIKFLGYFKDELKASEAYQTELNNIT